MAEKYLGIEKYIFSDVYNLFLKYKDMTNEDYYWDCFIQEGTNLCDKYRRHRLVTLMVNAVVEQLEHKVSGKTSKDLTYQQWEQLLNISNKSI